MSFIINLTVDPSPAFKAYLDAHFLSLESKIMALQDDVNALKAAVLTLTTDVTQVGADVLAILAKLASAGNITPEQQADIEVATTALTDQNTAIEAADAKLKAALAASPPTAKAHNHP